MKKVIATLFLVVCLVTAGFAQVVSVYKDESGAEYFVDTKSIQRKDGLIIFVAVAKTPVVTALTEFATDCKTFVILQNRNILDDVIVTYEYRKFTPQPIVQGSKVAYPMNYVCGVQKKELDKKELIGLLAGNEVQ